MAMDRNVREQRAPNEESRLQPEPDLAEERLDMDQTVADGLSDEQNTEHVRDVSDPIPDEETADEGELYAEQQATVERADLDAMTAAVSELLSRKTEDEGFDVYAWSDGSVTNSETPPTDTAYLVSLFSPDDNPTEGEIRHVLAEGLRTSPDETLPE